MRKTSKIITAIALFLAAALLFCSCGGGIPPENIVTDTEPPDKEEKENDDGYLHIISEGKSYFNIVYSERANRDTIELAKEISAAVFRKTAVELRVKSDYVARVQDISESTLEILVGLTNRKSSIELNKKTDALKFAIKVTDTKVVIVGKSIDVLEAAVDYFISNYLYRGGTTVGEWIIKKNETYVSESFPYSFNNLMSERTKYTVKSTFVGGFDGEIGGGCVYGDGYYVLKKGEAGSSVAKYSMGNMSLTVVGNEVFFGDGELEYDASRGGIMLSGECLGAKKLLYLTDWGLGTMAEVLIPREVSAATYIGEGTYALFSADSGRLIITDSRFDESESSILEGISVRSMSSEGKYIYLLGENGVIYVYDRWGNYINEVSLELSGKTVKNVSSYGGKLYVGVYDAGANASSLYEIGIEIKK